MSYSFIRCVIFTLVADELGACWRVLAPFIIPLRGTDQRNHLECGSHVKIDSLEPVSPSPAGLDMQKSQTNDHLQDHTGEPITSITLSVSNGLV